MLDSVQRTAESRHFGADATLEEINAMPSEYAQILDDMSGEAYPRSEYDMMQTWPT